MLDKFIIGQYIPVDSLLHRLDARAKITIVFVFAASIFLANNYVAFLVATLYVALLIGLSRIPVRYLLRGLKPIYILIAVTFLVHIFFTRTGDALFSIGGFAIYSGGLRLGALIALRFLLLVSMTTLLTLTTAPIVVTDALESMLGLLKKIKVPVHELALMMSISLRFIPTLLQETDKIMKAQVARGVEFSSGSLKARVQAIVPLLIPLFVSAFKRAEELATAMEARGYKGSEGRTKYRVMQMRGIDYLMIGGVIVLAGVLFWLRM